MLVFEEGGKPEYPEKNPRSKGENQQQTQPILTTNSTHITIYQGQTVHSSLKQGKDKRASYFTVYLFYSVKIRFFSGREILVIHLNLWDIIYN